MLNLTHFNDEGRAKMVDISNKKTNVREAVAGGTVQLNAETFGLIMRGEIKKGDVLAVAQVAGIMAAKRTFEIVPMCHPIAITGIDISLTPDDRRNIVNIRATVRCKGETGVEMEALTAVTAAALTIYDMCKTVQKDIEISDIRLLRKAGGNSGVYTSNEQETGKKEQVKRRKQPQSTDREIKPTVQAVCMSENKGTAKTCVPEILLKENHGVVGDAHAGGGHRQVSLLAEESVDKLRVKIPGLEPGVFAENILTSGICLYELPVGTKLCIGSALLEITQIGKDCRNEGCAIKKQTGECVVPREGIFAAVVKEGIIKPRDEIKIDNQ